MQSEHKPAVPQKPIDLELLKPVSEAIDRHGASMERAANKIHEASTILRDVANTPNKNVDAVAGSLSVCAVCIVFASVVLAVGAYLWRR